MTKKEKYTQQQWLDFALNVLIKKGPESLKITPLCDLKGVTKGSFYHHFQNRAVFIEKLMNYWFEKMTLDFIKQANTEATPLERLQKLDQVIASNDIEAEMHIRAWALKEPSIGQYLMQIDNQRRDYLAQCYIGLGLEKNQANDIALMSYANFLGMQQIHPKPDIESVLRVSAMAAKAFLPQIE